MLTELLAPVNYATYNISLAHKIGRDLAIYITTALNINYKAIRKDALDEDYFTIDRKYFYDRSDINETEQLEIEKKLTTYMILEKHPTKDATFRVNWGVINSLMCMDTESLTKVVEVAPPIKRTRKTTRSPKETNEQKAERLSMAVDTNDDDVRRAYYNWIFQILESGKGAINESYIKEAHKVFTAECGGNKNSMLEMLYIGETRQWKGHEWIVKRYNEVHPKVECATYPTVTECSSFSDVAF